MARDNIDGALSELGFPQNVISAAEKARQYIQQNGLSQWKWTDAFKGGTRNRLVGALAKTKQQIDNALGKNNNMQASVQASILASDPILAVIVAVLQTSAAQTGVNYGGEQGRIGLKRDSVFTGNSKHAGEQYTNGNYYDYQKEIVAQYQQGTNISVDSELGIPIPTNDKQLLHTIRNWVDRYKTEYDKQGIDDSVGEAAYRGDINRLLSDLNKALQARENVIQRNGYGTNAMYDCNAVSSNQIDDEIWRLQEFLINYGKSNSRYFEEVCSKIAKGQKGESSYPQVYTWMTVDFPADSIEKTAGLYKSNIPKQAAPAN